MLRCHADGRRCFRDVAACRRERMRMMPARQRDGRA